MLRCTFFAHFHQLLYGIHLNQSAYHKTNKVLPCSFLLLSKNQQVIRYSELTKILIKQKEKEAIELERESQTKVQITPTYLLDFS